MTKHLFSVISLLLLAPGCQGPDSVLLATVDCDPNASPSYSIQVMLSEPSRREDTKIFPASPSGQPLHFPTSLALIVPRSHSGQLNLAFLALDANSGTTAHSTDTTTLEEGAETKISVNLTSGNDLCGNRILDPGEKCDDGNLFSFDGCDFNCQMESPSTNQQADAGSPDTKIADSSPPPDTSSIPDSSLPDTLPPDTSIPDTLASPNPDMRPTGTTVTFLNGKAMGAMTGNGWVALGPLDSLSDPKCGTATYTSTTTNCAATTWNTTSSLCITGTIPALNAIPDYTDNWGIQIGVDATDPADTGLGQTLTSVAITVTGIPTSGLRAMVHRMNDPVGSNYCSPMTSGTAIPFTNFNTKCYDTPPDGTPLTAADVTNIDQVSVQVSSSSTAITVTNLCITKITFTR